MTKEEFERELIRRRGKSVAHLLKPTYEAAYKAAQADMLEDMRVLKDALSNCLDDMEQLRASGAARS